MKNTKVAKIAPLSLLLGPFVAKNQEIYKDDPRMLAKFDDLKLEDLEIGQVTKEDGLHSASIKSTTRGFEGPAQKWRPVNINSDKVMILTSDEIFESKEAAVAMVDGGVFSYLTAEGDSKVVIVLPSTLSRNTTVSTAGFMLVEASRFSIEASAVDHVWLPEDEAGTLRIDDAFIVGEIEFVLGKALVDELEEGEPMELQAS